MMNDILRNAFYEEADELFQEIEDCILDIDSSGVTREKIDSLFRYMHTLKGSSAAMEINDMAKLTHHLEEILGLVRDQKLELTREMIDQMLRCLDEFKIRVSKHKKDEPYEIDVAYYISILDRLQAQEGDTAAEILAAPPNTTGSDLAVNTTGLDLGLEDKIYKIQVVLQKDTPMKGARLFIVEDKLSKSGRVQETSWAGMDFEQISGETFHITYISNLNQKEIEDLVYSISDIEKVEVAEVNVTTTKEQPVRNKEELQTVIRVDIKKLDQLLRLVEELSVDKERLKQLMKLVEQKYKGDEDVKALSSLVHQIDFIGNEMQESVMSTRMYTLDKDIKV